MNVKKISLIVIAHLLTTTTFCQKIVGVGNAVNPYQYESIKNNIVSSAAVVSAHPLASKVGIQIMKQGGNAFDAAIATQLVLAVVYPGAGNIGGGGFLVARKNNGKVFTYDYRETAPSNASRDMYLDKHGNAQTNLSQNGHLAAGVPGSIAGMYATLEHCLLNWKTLVQPAIDIAEFGFCITPAEASNLNGYKNEFIKYNTMPTAFVKNDNWKKGDTLIQTDLANTLKRIRDNGAKGFYEGETAALIVAEMKRASGIISLDDLKNYKPKSREAIQFKYKKDYTIITMPPPSSGGILLTQMMNMLHDRNVKKMGFQTKEYIQLITEVERRAYADRAEHLGDADFYPVPVKTLTSKSYAIERMKNFDATIAQKSTEIKAGIIKKESEETTHISIMDKFGNMVTITTTLNGGYGSKTVVGGAGFLLNNEMDDFSVKPGVPNLYGAVGGEANSIQPNKRMLSSMTPTLVLKNGKPFIVCGTPGGTTIITSVLQTLMNIIEFDMNAKDAVNKPKFHHQWLPDVVFVEKEVNATAIKSLETMGYKIEKRGAIGRTEVIKITGKNKLEIAADTRGDDAAEGY
jgi:gamma-glutamyltranspeptidase / glutathione hydrolase